MLLLKEGMYRNAEEDDDAHVFSRQRNESFLEDSEAEAVFELND